MAETYDKPVNANLVGRAFYVFNRKPQHDKDNDKYLYKLELALTKEDGTPIIFKNKTTGVEVNMVERAKELGLIIKEPVGIIDGTHVKLKREVKTLADGSKTLPPETKTTSGQDFPDIIGNNSLVKIDFAAIPIRKGKFQGKNSGYLNKITVIDHVPYITKMDEYEFNEAPAKATPAVDKKVVAAQKADYTEELVELED